MKLDLTMQEYEDLMKCTAVGVSKAREWLRAAEQDEFGRVEDVEHYYDLLERLAALDDKIRMNYGGDQ